MPSKPAPLSEPELSWSAVPLPFTDSREHILAELERIDLLIETQIARARQSQEHDSLRGLYISEQELDSLLARPIGMPHWAAAPASASQSGIASALEQMRADLQDRVDESLRRRVPLRLPSLVDRYQLSPFDTSVVLICLAAELDLRYERLYAYLQDDVSKKRPSVDLAINLCCDSLGEKLNARQRFSPTAPLLRHRLVALTDEPGYPAVSLLNRHLKLDDRLVDHLLGQDQLDERISPYASLIEPLFDLEELILSAEMRARLHSLSHTEAGVWPGLTVYFQGPYGVGKRSAAEALCKLAGCRLILIDGAHLLSAGSGSFVSLTHAVLREATLQNAAIYWQHFDALLVDDQYAARKALLQQIKEWNGMAFLTGEAHWETADSPGLRITRIEFSRPCYEDRVRLWQLALGTADHADSAVLANRFHFSGGQIRDASATARNLALQQESHDACPSMQHLLEACRLQSNRKLASLATHIRPRYTFEDIVLPPDCLRQLKEMRNAVACRSTVHDEWGFGAKLSLGKGFSLLFAGPSGTGKTMAAEILAHELGLDLYKIDLSSIVSKYIGETEKNLSRIFSEAETSNAILFFDEADALFGKRSEVRDSHDRYANIEVNYLLQRIEEYEGVIILASNLRKNMDEAFVRRIHATLEFPTPNVEDRLRIWHNVWPIKTPREELDLEFMARRFELTGGNIRNIALAAAFLGAQNGGCVRMEHLIRATWKEYQKMGKVIMEGEFGRYAQLAHVL